VINAAKDPKGYYIALGVAEEATTDEIKSAFRSKAKRLHPDHNPSPIAAKQFHRVHEAYETLSDPTKRAAYDRGWRTVSGGAKASSQKPNTEPPKPETPRSEPPKPEPLKAESVKPQKPSQEKAARSDTTPRNDIADQPSLCQCGKVTAQPRYVIFDMVWGRLTKVNRRGLSGVYCRSCADKAALRASLVTWLAGWWSWPTGPRETVKALLNNIRGGRKPPERNARLLIKQSRAFRARGDMQLARACAEQALQFATNAGLRREVDSLLVSLSSFPAREIKDRWATPGWAPFAQLAPIGLLVVAVSLTVTMSAPRSLIETAKSVLTEPAAPRVSTPMIQTSDVRTGRIYAVAVEALPLRTGPGEAYRIDILLKQNTVVLVTEQDPGGQWVRILLNDGASGFVEAARLTPDVDMDALNALGAFGADRKPPAETPSP
jgi:hypothetical protein